MTVRLAVAECEPDVAVPVTVNVDVDAAALAAAETVKVALPPAVTDDGLIEPVTPAGSPVTDNDTVCALPLTIAVFTVYDVDDPAATVALAGLTDTEKSFEGGAVIVNVIEVEWVADGAVPLTVTV